MTVYVETEADVRKSLSDSDAGRALNLFLSIAENAEVMDEDELVQDVLALQHWILDRVRG